MSKIPGNNLLTLKKLGINTYKEAIIYLRADCPICRAEGFDTHARVGINLGDRFILATLNTIDTDLLYPGEAGLSSYAWELLSAEEGDQVSLSHPKHLHSLSFVRAKIYGVSLGEHEIDAVIHDISIGRYTDIHIASFLSACAGGRLSLPEIASLTTAMIKAGDKIIWPQGMIVDKHSVGGLPGNRTTLIVVPIVAAFGLIMPKTSSRAITSPSGSADAMETIAPVNLSLKAMRRVVEKENGCIIWGGAVSLSPADDILIRVERALELDSEGQLVASVLSKKIAAGSNHILIDMPVGPTTKLRDAAMVDIVKTALLTVSASLGVKVVVHESDGSQPVGYGIGPALEARDALAVLQNKSSAPNDLRERALTLAAHVLAFSPNIDYIQGRNLAEDILTSGKAWEKFQSICLAQGGMQEPQLAPHTHTLTAKALGQVCHIDNRQITRLAKLAGAPYSKGAGVYMHVKMRDLVDKDQPLLTLYSQSRGELNYAINSLQADTQPIEMEYHV